MTTHDEASSIGFTSYRMGRDDFGERLFVIDSVGIMSGSGKCLKVHYEIITGYWTGGGLDIHFADPNIGGDPDGYDELWITWDWKFATGWQWGPHNYQKIFRAYSAVDYQQHWNNNWSLSSASNPAPGKTGYLIDDFISPLVNYGPCYRPDTAYQTYSYQDYNCSWSDYFNDGQWHHVMFNIKMNNIGDSNTVDDFYIDGVLRGQLGVPVMLRTDPNRKFNCLILFDNFYSDLTDTLEQCCFVDNIAIYNANPVAVNESEGNDNNCSNAFQIYNGVNFITFSNLNYGDIVKIYNISGRLLNNSSEITGNTYRWNISDLPSGIYFYTIKGNNEISGKMMIVK